MLRYDDPRDAPNIRPVRKLFVMVLLIALREGATRVMFRPGEHQVDMSCEVDGVWYEYVPPPRHVWHALVAEARRVCRLVRPDRAVGVGDRLRTWFGRASEPEAGWLTFRLRGRDYLFTVRLDAREPGAELRLELLGPPTPLQAAAEELSKLCTRIDEYGVELTEFPDL